MLVGLFLVVVVAGLVALDVVALKWGKNSRETELFREMEGR